MEVGRSFDVVAALYDAQRSAYPEELFADISEISALERGDRVLEVGCGSGQATSGFVALGLDVTAVDPGASLVALAREKFENSSKVHFVLASFEEWRLSKNTFDVVAAAQSWHWVRPEIGFEKAADALVSGGHLAIFGHTPMWSSEIVRRLAPVYQRLAPKLGVPRPENWYLPSGPISGQLVASGRFAPATHRSYTWRRRFVERICSVPGNAIGSSQIGEGASRRLAVGSGSKSPRGSPHRLGDEPLCCGGQEGLAVALIAVAALSITIRLSPAPAKTPAW